MSLELEGKILEVSEEQLLPKLEVLGAVEIFRWKLTAVWMQDPNSLKKVRIRDEDSNGTIIEQKIEPEKIEWIKKCKEIPMKVDNFEEAITFFKHLWYEIISKSIKTRVSYLLNKEKEIKVEFDKYLLLDGRDDIPEFLEIEAKTIEDIYATAQKLWFQKTDIKDWWAKELLNHYDI